MGAHGLTATKKTPKKQIIIQSSIPVVKTIWNAYWLQLIKPTASSDILMNALKFPVAEEERKVKKESFVWILTYILIDILWW